MDEGVVELLSPCGTPPLCKQLAKEKKNVIQEIYYTLTVVFIFTKLRIFIFLNYASMYNWKFLRKICNFISFFAKHVI